MFLKDANYIRLWAGISISRLDKQFFLNNETSFIMNMYNDYTHQTVQRLKIPQLACGKKRKILC